MGFHPRPLLALLALIAAGCTIPGRGGDAVRAVPLYERERPVPSAPLVTDVLLPFGHGEASAARRTAGVRPLFRTFESDDTEGIEILYPLYRSRREKGEVLTRLFPIYWHDEFTRADGEVDSDTAILPFLLWGSDPAEGGYFLLFPLGGTALQKFFSDRITMVLFPLYARTETKEWRGNHVLWPLVHWGSDGKDVHAFRVLPFYGESVHEGHFSRHTALWPFIHWAEEDLHKPHPTRGWSVWPLVGTEGSVNDPQYATYALWPFFSWADGPRAYERSLPYPLFRVRKEWTRGADGEPVLASDLFWLWPFYGRYDRGEEQHDRFYLWPVVFTKDLAVAGLREKGLAVMPFWRSIERETPEGASVDRWWKFWPLAQGERRRDGTSGWSALAPIPWFRWEEFDANWGIFFELARVRSDPDGSRSVDLLFSLLRSRTGPGESHHRIPLVVRADRDATGSSWSLVEGLLGAETDADGRTSLRLLWFLRIPLWGGGP
jgi:hypothetical protein